jgi:hypothetical protein
MSIDAAAAAVNELLGRPKVFPFCKVIVAAADADCFLPTSVDWWPDLSVKL